MVMMVRKSSKREDMSGSSGSRKAPRVKTSLVNKNFCAFILTHGRPKNQKTLKTLKDYGYTGKTYLVVDDKDPTLEEYQDLYGDMVLVFSKDEIAKTMDQGDNQPKRSVVFARNACFDLARNLGFETFIQLDDDYVLFDWRNDSKLEWGYIPMRNLDLVFKAALEYYADAPFSALCFSQTGDFIGGKKGNIGGKVALIRKAMNSWICSTSRQFSFVGQLNDDVNTYMSHGNRGLLFGTLTMASLQQTQTQASEGGLTELYIDSGTYVKSFYTVMYGPSYCTVNMMGPVHPRLHHRILWGNAVPKILSEDHGRNHA